MKKQLSALSLGVFLAGCNFGFAQQQLPKTCNSDAAMEERFLAEPAARANFDAIQEEYRASFNELRNGQVAGKTTATQYTIPVVFHILHQGGPENVTDAQCIAALDQINRDFAREGADTNTIFTPFKSLYINSDIKLMLAKKDPNGNCISGIVRHIDPKTIWYQGTANASSYWTYTWDPTRYLNIYIVNFIVPSGPVSGGGVAGYTYRPGTWPTGNSHDAIIFTYNTMLPNAAGYQPRAMTHEVGHWLNLPHTFGNTNNPGVNCGDDNIGDTPVTKGNYNACPMSTTNTAIVCAPNLSLYYQNVENIMDYSTCAKNFTTDQTTVMRNTLQGTTNGRNNLITNSNLSVNFTDVGGLGLCAPFADFMSTTKNYTICLNGTLNFKDYSYSSITSRQWATPPGAVIASPTGSVTGITFNTLGVVDVSLTVTNAQGSDTEVRQVTVIDGSNAIQGMFVESFEALGVPPGWNVYNAQNGAFKQTSLAAYDALNSFFVEGSQSAGGDVDILEMPMINLQSNPNAIFTFAYSYARKNSTHNDVFRLQMSSNCGGSWTDVVSLAASNMAGQTGGGTTATPYYPLSASDWAIVDVTTYPNWQNFITSPHVLIRFTFEEGDAGQGNNFFVDAINITGAVGLNELTRKINLNLYPNPSKGSSNLQFTLSETSNVKVSIVDVVGRQVTAETNNDFEAGQHTLQLNQDKALPAGVYFVNVSLNGTKMIRKMVIE